jgi:hypothetical protein
MSTRHVLCLEQKMNLIKEIENGLSRRILSENFLFELELIQTKMHFGIFEIYT